MMNILHPTYAKLAFYSSSPLTAVDSNDEMRVGLLINAYAC